MAALLINLPLSLQPIRYGECILNDLLKNKIMISGFCLNFKLRSKAAAFQSIRPLNTPRHINRNLHPWRRQFQNVFLAALMDDHAPTGERGQGAPNVKLSCSIPKLEFENNAVQNAEYTSVIRHN